MPVYEFICNACKSPLSVFVRSMNSEVNANCEKCGSIDLTRAISGFAVLRGSASGLDFDSSDPGMASMMLQMGGMGGMDDFGEDF